MPSRLPPPGCLWEATSPPAQEFPALAETVRAHVAVVGGGYTGLSAALHIAEAGHEVVLLDAHAPGWGASGRNGGQVIAGLKYDPEYLLTRFAVRGPRMVQTIGAAPDLVFDLIARHGIECDPVRAGWLQLAVSDATFSVLHHRVRQWRDQSADVTLLDAADTARLTGSPGYAGAMLDRRGGTVQPLAYARGLAAAAAHAGARIFAATPAMALGRDRAGWRVRTPGGTVVAERVILATNAYADNLHPGLRRSTVAVPSWQVATDPLPEALQREILPERQAGSDTRRLLRYFRLDAAGRFILGSRGAYGEPQSAAVVRRLCAAATSLYPQLHGIPFTYQWGGMVAITRDNLPHLHVLAPGLFAGVGYNGRGVAMATVMGRELALLATIADPDALGLPLMKLRPIPLHAASRLGVRAAVAWHRLIEGK